MKKIGGCIFTSDTSSLHHSVVKSKDDLIPSFSLTPQLKKLAASSNFDKHIIPEYTPISNQLGLSSCVANATCDAFEILKGLEDPSGIRQLSRLFVYWNARLANKDTDKDEGTYIMNAFESLVTFGVCEESSWAYDENKVFAQPNQLAYKEGDDNTFKLDSFYKIRSTGISKLEEIETAIRANHPVVFGTDVGVELQVFDGDDKALNYPINSIGGHAMVCVGVRRNPNLEFYIRNSWGSNWGIDGHVWFSSSYMMSPNTNDLYVGTRMDNLLK